MDDLISRQAAIDIAEKAFIRGLLATPDLRRLPAAHPKTANIKVIRSKCGDLCGCECGCGAKLIQEESK